MFLLGKVAADAEVATAINEWHWVKEDAERELATIYLDRALLAREQDHWHEVGANVNDLVRLCLIDPEVEQSNTVNRECSSILGAWYRLNGQKHRAMRCTKPKLQHGIDVLSDDDLENDLEAWQCIGDACLAVGDTERVVAAVGMQKQIVRFGFTEIDGVTLRKDQDIDTAAEFTNTSAVGGSEVDATEQREDEVAKESADDSLRLVNYWYTCDGVCFDNILNTDTFYRCSCCILDFCKSCHEMITNEETKEFNVCSPSHERHMMPGLGTRFEKHCIVSGGKSVSVFEWLNSLKEAWGIPLSKTSEV